MTKKAYIGLGSNQRDPARQIREAIKKIKRIPCSSLEKLSSLYRSKPLGVEGQPDFINAVLQLNTQLLPLELLDRLQDIEKQHGRIRLQHWGPRTLDLDILLYGSLSMNDQRLTIPHREIKNRGFVLIPLAEIDQTLEITGLGPVSKLLQGCTTTDIQRLA